MCESPRIDSMHQHDSGLSMHPILRLTGVAQGIEESSLAQVIYMNLWEVDRMDDERMGYSTWMALPA